MLNSFLNQCCTISEIFLVSGVLYKFIFQTHYKSKQFKIDVFLNHRLKPMQVYAVLFKSLLKHFCVNSCKFLLNQFLNQYCAIPHNHSSLFVAVSYVSPTNYVLSLKTNHSLCHLKKLLQVEVVLSKSFPHKLGATFQNNSILLSALQSFS